jgi:hypothetical protein
MIELPSCNLGGKLWFNVQPPPLPPSPILVYFLKQGLYITCSTLFLPLFLIGVDHVIKSLCFEPWDFVGTNSIYNCFLHINKTI